MPRKDPRANNPDWFGEDEDPSDIAPLTSSVPKFRQPIRRTPSGRAMPADAPPDESDDPPPPTVAVPQPATTAAPGSERKRIAGKRPGARPASARRPRPQSEPPRPASTGTSSASTVVDPNNPGGASTDVISAGENAIRVLRGGKFRTRGNLGKGGAGSVMEARDLSLRREVAVKRPLDQDDAAARLRFIEEAQITAQLQHPNIIPVYELGIDDDEHPFIAMKRIHGRNFGEILVEDFHTRPTSYREFLARLRRHLDIFRKVCDAMSYAHSKGVIHRDLKPGNIMVGEFGEVLVVDWGLARPIGSLEQQMTFAAHAVTSDRRLASIELSSVSGPIVGTLPYMPPEQAAGEPLTDVHGDVYSLGAILYVMLCGRPPVSPRDPDPLVAVRDGKFKAPTKHALDPEWVPSELEAVALKAMKHSPRDRYPSASALSADIEAWISGHTLAVVDYSTFARVRKWAVRHWPAVTTGAIAFVVLLVSAIAFVLSLDAARSRAETARDLAEREARRASQAEQEAKLAAEAEREASEVARQATLDTRRQVALGLIAQADALVSANRLLEADTRLDEAAGVLTDIGGNQLPVELARVEVMRANPPPILARPGGEYLCVAPRQDDHVVIHCGRQAVEAQDARTLRRLWRHDDAHAAAIEDITAIPARGWVATADRDGVIKVWSIETGALVMEHQHVDHVMSIAASSDGSLLCVGDSTGRLQVWRLSARAELTPQFQARAHAAEARAVAFSPDGTMLASGGRDSLVRVIDLVNKEALSTFRMDGMVRAVAFSPDNEHLYAGGVGTRLHVLNPRSKQRIAMKQGHVNSICTISVSEDGTFVATGSFDGRAIVWSREDDYEISSTSWLTTDVNGVAFLPGDRLVVSNGSQTLLYALHPQAPGDPQLPGVPTQMWTVLVSPDGRRVLVSCADGALRVFDRATGQHLDTLKGHGSVVWDIAQSADGQYLFDASRDGVAVMWDAASGQPIRRFNGHTADVRVVEVSPDGTTLLTGGYDSMIRTWDIATGRELVARAGPGDKEILSAGFSPDGTRMFATGAGNVAVYDVATGTELVAGKVPSGAGAKSGVWARDDCIVLGADPMMFLDPDDLSVVARLAGHVNSIFEVVVSPDRKWLATAGEDQTVRLWDIDARREIRLLGRHSQRVRSVTFAPDGRSLFSTGDDGRIRHWPLDYVRELADGERKANQACDLLAATPGSADGWRELSQWFAFRGLPQEALHCLRRAGRDDGSLDARLDRAALHWRAGASRAAFELYTALMHDADAPSAVRLHARLCARAANR